MARADRLNAEDYHYLRGLSRYVDRVHLQPGRELPRTVPEGEVLKFADSLIGSGVLAREDASPVKEGEAVRVTAGPFASFSGVVEEITEAGKFKIAVCIFGRATPIELDVDEFERI